MLEKSPLDDLYVAAQEMWLYNKVYLDVITAAARFGTPLRETNYAISHAVVSIRYLPFARSGVDTVKAFKRVPDLHLFLEKMMRNMSMIPLMPLLGFSDGISRVYRLLSCMGGNSYYLSQWHTRIRWSLADFVVCLAGVEGHSQLVCTIDELRSYDIYLPELSEFMKCFRKEEWQRVTRRE